jgi:hypothetical protein
VPVLPPVVAGVVAAPPTFAAIVVESTAISPR